MKKLRFAIYAFIASWFVVVPVFFMASHASQVLARMEADGAEGPFLFRSTLYSWVVVGLVADAAWNLSYGTVRFREFPQEILFTSRVNRLIKNDDWRGELALEWCQFMEYVDEAHCSNLDNVLYGIPYD